MITRKKNCYDCKHCSYTDYGKSGHCTKDNPALEVMSNRIRDRLGELGITITDTKDGPTWKLG